MICCICQGEDLPLLNTCADSTCQNLKIHPKCFIELKQNFPTCTICEHEYVIQFSNPNFFEKIKFIYVQSWYNFAVTTLITVILFIAIVSATVIIFVISRPSQIILFWVFCAILSVAIPTFCWIRDIKTFFACRDIQVLVSEKNIRYSILS